MKNFRFNGVDQCNPEMPDGTMVTVNPGDIMALPYDDPGPLWTEVPDKPTVAAPESVPEEWTPPEATSASVQLPAEADVPPVETLADPTATPEEA